MATTSLSRLEFVHRRIRVETRLWIGESRYRSKRIYVEFFNCSLSLFLFLRFVIRKQSWLCHSLLLVRLFRHSRDDDECGNTFVCLMIFFL